MASASGSAPEVLVTADDNGKPYNVRLWNPSTGAFLSGYKGGAATAPNTFCVVADSFLISAGTSKPLLNVWRQHRQDLHSACRLVAPGGPVRALSGSPSGRHLAAAVDRDLFVWQTSSGALLAAARKAHLSEITHLTFTDDGSHLISAGKDGGVSVWPMLHLLTKASSSATPWRAWKDHQLDVSGLFVTGGGIHSRVVSVSLDQTCVMRCLISGKLLLKVDVGHVLHCICLDSAETEAFVGGSDGAVRALPLVEPPRSIQVTREQLQGRGRLFRGVAKKPVRCVSVSLDGRLLASGGDDASVRLWNLISEECIRTLEHSGRITALRFIIPCKGMLEVDEYKQSIFLASSLDKVVRDESVDLQGSYIVGERIGDDSFEFTDSVDPSRTTKSETPTSESDEHVNKLKAANLKLYNMLKNRIMQENVG